MMINSSKIVFWIILFLSTMITMSANDWIGMWKDLEINLMAFFPLISKSKEKNSSQAMMIYILAQSIRSIILLFSILMSLIMTPLMNNIPLSLSIIN